MQIRSDCLLLKLLEWLVFLNVLCVGAGHCGADERPDLVASAASADADRRQFFENKIRPALATHCYECHSLDTEASGGLRLDTRLGWQMGGDLGPAIVPGDPVTSRLIQAIEYNDPDLQMPPDGKLPPSVIDDLRRWIQDGAVDPREATSASDSPARRPALRPAEAQQHWAYRPIQRPEVPCPTDVSDRTDLSHKVQSRPIDRFLAVGWSRAGDVSAPASRAALIRRLTFDLHGLPPTPAEAAAFCQDSRPAAYRRLVDRLLASPRFGERFARRWLDVARYAESLTLRGFVLPDAWRYRDYCIQAFNQDRPFDEVIREQIAGDLMDSPDPHRRQQQLIAVTFLLMGNTNLEDQDKQQLEMDVVDEQLETLGRAFLAQTIGCARCHDHKFDPIPTHDYYALAGILKSSNSLEHANVSKWLDRPLPLDATDEAHYAQLEAELVSLDAQIAEIELRLKANSTATVGPVQELPGAVVESIQGLQRDLATRRKRRTDVAKQAAERPKTMALMPVPNSSDLQIHIRGSVHTLGERAPRGFLQAASWTAPNETPNCDRLALAHWLTDARHPLTARVIANRVWLWIMGQGLVRSVDNFGTTGEAPTHPELLDWLAVELRDNHWSIKHLVRQIVLSDAYCRSSRATPEAGEADAENRSWTHAELKVVDAESLRDAMLLISGELQVCDGGNHLPTGMASDYNYIHNEPCRSVYLPVLRNSLPAILEAFDFANPSVGIGQRDRTVVPQQALYLMNDAWVTERASRTAARIISSGPVSVEECLSRAAWLCYGRPLLPHELQVLSSLMGGPTATSIDPSQLTMVVKILFASVDFRYLE